MGTFEALGLLDPTEQDDEIVFLSASELEKKKRNDSKIRHRASTEEEQHRCITVEYMPGS